MKKFLLSASILMMASASAFAVTDGQTYEKIDGLTCENLWVFDRNHTGEAYAANAIYNKAARTATTDGTTIYVGLSGETASIEKFSVATGEYLGSLALTLNGEAFAGTLAVNQVGFDEYGNFYAATYDATTDRSQATYKVYTVDLTTGAVTSVGDLYFESGKGRVDYCDVIGDITGKEANATVMACSCAGDNLNVFCWTREKDSDEWLGGWNGATFQAMTETCPTGVVGFNTGSVVKIVRTGQKTGDLEMFYVDGNYTFPALYGNDGAMMDNIKNADLTVTDKETGVTTGTVPDPTAGTNGIAEGVVGDKNMIAYSICQPNDGRFGSLAGLTTVNEDMAMESMKYLWTIPADGLGKESDGGTRVHSLFVLPQADGSALVVTFKCYNGLGVYKIAGAGGSVEEIAAAVTINTNGDVISVSEVAESIEVYNIAGQKVAEVRNASEIAAPANGVYVVKAVVAGTPVVKKVIL